MLACFAVAYGSLAFTAASVWSLPADVAPSPGHVASIGGIQNFADIEITRGRGSRPKQHRFPRL